MNKKGTRYKQHYRELIRRHFIHAEAVQFAVARTLRYSEFRRMTGARQFLWNGFVKAHPELARNTAEFHRAWVGFIKDWYVNHDLDTYDAQMHRVVSPWSWFDEVSYSLPEEMRYTKSYRRRARQGATDEESASKRAWRVKAIHQLKETLEKYPSRASQLVPQILRLGGKVSNKWRLKAGVA